MLDLKEWALSSTFGKSTNLVVRVVCSDSFPFKWWDVETLQFALSQYKRLCPDDPNKLGPHGSAALYEMASAYREYVASEKLSELRRAENERLVEKIARKQKRKVGMQKKKAVEMAVFPSFIKSVLGIRTTPEFDAAFLEAAFAGRFHESAMRGNVKIKVAAAMPEKFTPDINALYAEYINNPGISKFKTRQKQ